MSLLAVVQTLFKTQISKQGKDLNLFIFYAWISQSVYVKCRGLFITKLTYFSGNGRAPIWPHDLCHLVILVANIYSLCTNTKLKVIRVKRLNFLLISRKLKKNQMLQVLYRLPIFWRLGNACKFRPIFYNTVFINMLFMQSIF